MKICETGNLFEVDIDLKNYPEINWPILDRNLAYKRLQVSSLDKNISYELEENLKSIISDKW